MAGMNITQHIRRLVPLVFMWCATGVFCYSRNSPSQEQERSAPSETVYRTGVEETEYLYRRFFSERFYVARQSLVPSGGTDFPQNVVVTIPGTLHGGPEARNIVFAFTSESAERNIDMLVSAAHAISASAFGYTVHFLLSAGDESFFLPNMETDFHPKGTAVFCDDVEYPDEWCAVVFSDAPSGRHAIIPGSGGATSPRWLVQALAGACSKIGAAVFIPGFFVSLYKHRIFPEDGRLSDFLLQEIPAAAMTVESGADLSQLLPAITESIERSSAFRWDSHYSFIPLGEAGLWPGESLYALCYLFFAVVVLAHLCFSAFAPTKRIAEYVRDIMRTWFFVPIIALVTSLMLSFSQRVFGLWVENTVLLFCIKLVFALLSVLLLFVAQIHRHFRISFNAIGYHMLIMAVVNIFIFATLDLSMLFLFFLLYVMAFAAKRADRPWSLIVTAMLIAMPAVPYMLSIVRYGEPSMLRSHVLCRYRNNLLLASALLPLQLQLERVLISLDIFGHEKIANRKQLVFRTFCSVMVSLSALGLLYGVSLFLFLRNSSRTRPSQVPSVHESAAGTAVTARLDETEFQDLTIHRLTIKSTADVIRYDVTLSSEYDVPLYDSNFEYSFTDDSTVHFHLPYYPGPEVELSYSAETGTRSFIHIDAYFFGEARQVMHEAVELARSGGS